MANTTKIGIGLGIPLGVLTVAILVFVCVYWNHVRNLWTQSRFKAGGSTSNTQNEGHTEPASTEQTKPHELDDDGVRYEVQDTAILHYSRELEGSPGLAREELPD